MNYSSNRFELTSHWRIAASVDRVWSVLTDLQRWPSWWPYVRSVERLEGGNGVGLGAIHRIQWATRLPYSIDIEVRSIEIQRHERLRATASGQLEGEGLWLLRSAGDLTEVTYQWRVEVTKRWMRGLSPILAPVFRWNHDGVMAAGERGLQRILASSTD